MRLRSDFWVAAYLRRCNAAGGSAVLRRHGAAESGAILIRVDRLDGTSLLLGPVPQSEADGQGERRFAPVHKEPVLDGPTVETRLRREIEFDSDLWIVEVEDRRGRTFLGASELQMPPPRAADPDSG